MAKVKQLPGRQSVYPVWQLRGGPPEGRAALRVLPPMPSCLPGNWHLAHLYTPHSYPALATAGALGKRLSRRAFLLAAALALMGGCRPKASFPSDTEGWHELLLDYEQCARDNVVEVDGRRAMLASPLYPCTYIRDALFWGPLALGDSDLGLDCYLWFAGSQLPSGQIRSAVALRPAQEPLCIPTDDEGTLLFVIASDWLDSQGHRHSLDMDRIAAAYAWVQTHVRDDLYVSAPGPFRYWADTVSPDVEEVISHNQGLLCLARRAMVRLGLLGVSEAQVLAAQQGYRSFYSATDGYVHLGKNSRFAKAQDISAVFPEFLSRYLYGERILSDQMVLSHVTRILGNAAVYTAGRRLAGIKVISSPGGGFLDPSWFHEPSLNPRGDYQNGGYWPMYTIVALALAYSISRSETYKATVAQLVINELAEDHQPKEVIRLTPGAVGTFDPARCNYAWNALIALACRWSGLA